MFRFCWIGLRSEPDGEILFVLRASCKNEPHSYIPRSVGPMWWILKAVHHVVPCLMKSFFSDSAGISQCGSPSSGEPLGLSYRAVLSPGAQMWHSFCLRCWQWKFFPKKERGGL